MKKDKTSAKWIKWATQSKILTSLNEPLTFTELLERTNFSRATLSSHLRILLKKGLIQRVWSNKRVYQVVSKEKVTQEISSTINFLLGYIFGVLSSKSKKSIREIVKEATEKRSEEPFEQPPPIVESAEKV